MPAGDGWQLTAVQRGAIVRNAAAQTAQPASRTWRRRTWQVAVVAASLLFMGYVLVKLRYKQPDGDTSLLLEQPVRDTGLGLEAADADLRFAAAVAAFGMQLRGSPHLGDFTWDGILELARQGLGPDRGGYRSEFVRLIGVAMGLQGSRGR